VISDLGRGVILIALAASMTGGCLGIAAGMKRNAQAWKRSRIAAYVAFAATTIAMFLMEYALVTHDFSVSYVAKVGSTTSPTWVSMVSLWSSLEGSILLWAFVLTGYIASFAWFTKGKYTEHSPWALGSSQLVAVFFCFLVSSIANPFSPTPLPIPTEGPGPNPLLQNHILMVIHPPMLYLGYVGMSVPFGMGLATLLVGKVGSAWSQALRRWMLLPWGCLTIGILLGGWWSYEVLGWGGYWAWDPVENASFLPWLTATAFIHSAIMMERKDQLRGWAICLLLVTFLLTLLGTFMTRSGVFNSVHSFTKTPIGPIFLGFLALCSIISVVLLAARIDTLKGSPDDNTSLATRETAFLFNNFLFVAFTFTVLIGTVYPLVYEAIQNKKLSIGEPYFNELGIPISIAIVFLMGVGPALPWGTSNLGRLVAPGIGALLASGIALGFGAEGIMPLVSFSVCGFAFVTTIREFVEPARARSKKKEELFVVAQWKIIKKMRRRFGGYIVHLGVIMIAVAVTGSSAYKQESEFILSPNQMASFAGYDITYLEATSEEEPHRSSQMANLHVVRDGTDLGIVRPRLNTYFRMGSVIGTPAVKTSLDEDLYITLVKLEEDGRIIGIKVIIEPLIFWLWFGGGIMGLGTLVSAWPARKKKRPPTEEDVA
jgi:cytochrome c-type biogenesis protein CcmF